jgi:hypothetical protein
VIDPPPSSTSHAASDRLRIWAPRVLCPLAVLAMETELIRLRLPLSSVRPTLVAATVVALASLGFAANFMRISIGMLSRLGVQPPPGVVPEVGQEQSSARRGAAARPLPRPHAPEPVGVPGAWRKPPASTTIPAGTH